MPDLAKVLDDGYVPLGGAANSLARRLPGFTPDKFTFRALSLVGTDSNPHQQPVLDLPPANENFRRFIEKPALLRGRPRKIAWARIGELARQLASEHPDWQKKRLAFEAWGRARDEFSESELPSVATIQRSMIEILDG